MKKLKLNFKLWWHKLTNKVICLEELPPAEPLEKRIIDYLVEKDCWFLRPKFKGLYKTPESYLLHLLEFNTRDFRKQPNISDVALLGRFNVKLANIIRFEYYGRANKKYALKLCKDLQKRFGLIMACVLISEKNKVWET